MDYISTRGTKTRKKFSEILLEGLAPDGGLYMPEHYPVVQEVTLAQWRQLTYPELAFEICQLYIDDIPAEDLRRIIHQTYSATVFGTEAIVPLTQLEQNFYIAHLSNGPTYAFKDIALQLLGGLFEYELARQNKVLNILGATSGDTGSAAEYAMRGKKGIHVFMLSPDGRMSPFQKAQMYSLQDPNIHNLAIQGVFDDCQDIVKAVSNDLTFKKTHHIGTVNSINWARLLAQVVYYFYSYFRATENQQQQVSFAVPSGNFGNICAAHVARMMGLPVDQLILATNENDVLDEFFKTGCYRVRTSAQTYETSSPSMDISKASNFERFMFDFTGRDGQQIAQYFGHDVPEQGGFEISPDDVKRLKQQYGFVSGKSTHEDRLETIAATYRQFDYLLDPHTADGVKVAHEYQSDIHPVVVMETAQPCKFAATIHEALDIEPEMPAAVNELMKLPHQVTVLPVDVEAVKKEIVEKGL